MTLSVIIPTLNEEQALGQTLADLPPTHTSEIIIVDGGSTDRTLAIVITQSGETADTIAPTRYARERGCPVIAVTNTVGSAIGSAGNGSSHTRPARWSTKI